MLADYHDIPGGLNGDSTGYVFDSTPASSYKAEGRIGEGGIRAASGRKAKHLNSRVVSAAGTNVEWCGKKIIAVRIETADRRRALAPGALEQCSPGDRRLQAA